MFEDLPEHVRPHLRLAAVPEVPELRLYQLAEPLGLWDLTGGEYRSDQPPPFWAYPWPGGQVLARYLLDHPDTVAGRSVLDLGSGSGLVAIAAARAGAVRVRAVDVDPAAVTAIGLNADANQVRVMAERADLLDSDAGGAEVVLAGDACYSAAMTARVLDFLRRAARGGARILMGDADRGFFPRSAGHPIAVRQIPVRRELEGATTARTTVWGLGVGLRVGPTDPGHRRTRTAPMDVGD